MAKKKQKSDFETQNYQNRKKRTLGKKKVEKQHQKTSF